MAVNTITYANKVNLNENSGIAEINKVTDANMNEIKSVVNNNATELSNLQPVLLWTNSSPTSSFAAQTITLDTSMANFDCYEIICKNSVGTSGDDDNRTMSSGLLLKGNGTRLSFSYAGSGGVNTRSRAVSYSTDTTLSFATAYSAAGTTAWVQNNSLLVPLYVIGYKTGLF